MKLLAIDTSTEVASVALHNGKELFCEKLHSKKTHAQFVLPIIDRLLAQSGMQIKHLDRIIFGCGPGSFTGLRIACSIAKGLAYAHDLELIPVSSLGALAYAAREQEEYAHSPILAVLDARMQELYWSYFPENQLVAVDRVTAVQAIQLPEKQAFVIAGAGMDLYWNDLPDSIKSQVRARLTLYPDAAAMLRLAVSASLKPVPAAQAEPVYVRNQVTHGEKRG